MRGKACADLRGRGDCGITPARAGKSANARQMALRGRDHPRACGEKLAQSPRSSPIMGSPPRVRGKVRAKCKEDGTTGITPARAGKRCAGCLTPSRRRDHPRACGEKSLAVTPKPGEQGSPPRVRGKERACFAQGGQHGITPARAGKRSRQDTRPAFVWDHPRACGEKQGERWDEIAYAGSPPRVRGKAQCARPRLPCRGITPARAGKRQGIVCTAGGRRDHPRACGEKDQFLHAAEVVAGSPPRVRGKGSASAPSAPLPGITPARAGKRSRLPSPARPLSDHPRACGEKVSGFRPADGVRGSPPRVRGKA